MSGVQKVTLILRDEIPVHHAVKKWIDDMAPTDGRGRRAQELLVAALRKYAEVGLHPDEADISKKSGNDAAAKAEHPTDNKGGVKKEPAKRIPTERLEDISRKRRCQPR